MSTTLRSRMAIPVMYSRVSGIGERRRMASASAGPEAATAAARTRSPSGRKCDHDPCVCEEPEPALHNGFEYRLRICGGTADHPQNLGSRRLPLQRLPSLVEQPHVLDRDHRLVGEGPKQGDLSFGEELRLGAAQPDRADHDTFAHQRDGKDRVEAQAPCEFAAFGKFVRLGLDVSNVHRPLIENRSARRIAADQRKRFDLSDRPMMGDEKEPVAIQTPDGSVVCLAQPRRALADGVKHALNVDRRACDDAEDLAGRSLLLQGLGELLFQVGVGCAKAVNVSSRLRCLRTKTGNACSALRPFANQDHLVGSRAAPHSITSSARASRLSGTTRPSAFAVLRLITSSYLVGACTGRSAAFHPLRMRSTYWAAERNWLTRSDPYDIRPPASMK